MVVAPSVPYTVIYRQKTSLEGLKSQQFHFGVRFGFKLQAAVQIRSIHAHEDAKFGLSEGQGQDIEGSKQTYDDGGTCMPAASNCI